MFNERELVLLAILLGREEWISGKILAGMMNVGNRTLQSEIATVNSILSRSSGSTRISSNNRLGYRLEGNRDQIRKYVCEKGANSSRDTFDSANNILTVLLYERDYITLNRIAEKTFLATSSVSFNLERVKKMILRTRNAKLLVHQRKGYKLEAEEYLKRMLCVNALSDEISQTGRMYPEVTEGYELLDDVRRLLIKVFVPNEYVVEGKAFDAFSRYCAFSITRQKNNFVLDSIDTERKISETVFKIAEVFKKELDYTFSKEEMFLLNDRLEELNVIGTAKKEYPKIEKQIRTFFRVVEEETGLIMKADEDYLKRMSEHLYRMNRRVDIGNYLRTKDPETIEKQYPVALHLLRTCFQKEFRKTIPGNEERLLLPYISALLTVPDPKADICIISDQPVGEIYRYRMNLYETYGSLIGRIRIFPTYLYEERFQNILNDYICLTSEEELVFRHKELVYIDLYKEQYQSDLISKLIFDRSEQNKEKIFASFTKDLKNDKFLYTKKAESYEEVLSDQIREELLANTSISLVDNDTLLVISHGGTDHIQKKIVLKKSVSYKNRQISRILYFNIGHKENVNRFCEYIRKTLNQYN